MRDRATQTRVTASDGLHRAVWRHATIPQQQHRHTVLLNHEAAPSGPRVRQWSEGERQSATGRRAKMQRARHGTTTTPHATAGVAGSPAQSVGTSVTSTPPSPAAAPRRVPAASGASSVANGHGSSDVVSKKASGGGHKRMHRCRVMSYSVGHFFNDMVAATWCVPCTEAGARRVFGTDGLALHASCPGSPTSSSSSRRSSGAPHACCCCSCAWCGGPCYPSATLRAWMPADSRFVASVGSCCPPLSRLSSTSAGVVMFAGQATDAAGTLAVGILCDKTTGCPSVGLGRRKSWNFPGVIAVAGACCCRKAHYPHATASPTDVCTWHARVPQPVLSPSSPFVCLARWTARTRRAFR